MTYNIHHAEGLDHEINPERIADLIKTNYADLVALQEVDRGVARTAKRDLPAEFAKLTGMTCVFSNNFAFQGGEYGTAILSRFPVVKREHLLLKMVGSKEQRGLLCVHVQIGKREVVFMNTHLDYRNSDVERLESIKEIAPIIRAEAGQPVIFCGDFNDAPGSHVYDEMSQLMDDTWKLAGKGAGPTIPSESPNRRIDYIWVSKGGSVVPVRAWVPASMASDHCPVVAEFKLK